MGTYRERHIPISFFLLWILVFLVAGVFLWGVWSYRQVVELDEDISLQKSKIELQFRHRNALAAKLVEAIQAQEDSAGVLVVQEFSQAQTQLSQAQDIREKLQADSRMSQALEDLCENTRTVQWVQTQDCQEILKKLKGSEEQIDTIRMEYNTAAQDYNQEIQSFPGVVVANMFGFHAADFLMVSQAG